MWLACGVTHSRYINRENGIVFKFLLVYTQVGTEIVFDMQSDIIVK